MWYCNRIYFSTVCFELWNRPGNWTSGDPVFYRSLDAGTCLKLMNGAQSIEDKVSLPSIFEVTYFRPMDDQIFDTVGVFPNWTLHFRHHYTNTRNLVLRSIYIISFI